jgi:hypothetical protein
VYGLGQIAQFGGPAFAGVAQGNNLGAFSFLMINSPIRSFLFFFLP